MDAIKHVVLLMLENHSFDEMLGCFQQKYPNLNGVDPAAPPRANVDSSGRRCLQLEKKAYSMPLDPPHETKNVLAQIKDGNAGFVSAFAETHPQSRAEDRDWVMGYYPRGFLPALHQLAEDFTICDNWFSSLPGPTWPNRFFALSGTSSGRVRMPEGKQLYLDTIIDQTQDTLFDRLNEVGRNWKIYYYDFPSSLIFANQRKPHNLANYRFIDEFFKTAAGDAAQFPEFALIEPKYFGKDQNDDHPPHNIMKAEKLLADVYNAIRSNAPLWESTLLVAVFDEHGGFYDHVTPPAAVAPDAKTAEYNFRQLGVRVPALLISPWVKRDVDHTEYDHTSLLQFLTRQWGLGPLGQRTAAANTFPEHIFLDAPRDETDCVAFIRVPFSELIKDDTAAEELSNGHQEAIHAFAQFLEVELKEGSSRALTGVVVVAAKVSAAWVAVKGWIGDGLLWLGNALVSERSERKLNRIQKTVDIFSGIIGQRQAQQSGVPREESIG